MEVIMAKKENYQVARDGTLVPCVWELAFSLRNKSPQEAAAKLSAYLTAHGATEPEIEEAFSELRKHSLLSLSDEERVSPDRGLLSMCGSVKDCREACSLLLGNGGESSYCAICPVNERLGGVYTNALYADETALLGMLYVLAGDDETREILQIGDAGQLALLFSSNLFVKTYERRHVFPVPYILSYALYLMTKNRIYVNTENTDALCDSVVSILTSREIPNVGLINDVSRLFLDQTVRDYADRLCESVRYRDVDYLAAFRVLDLCGCKAYDEKRSVLIGEYEENRLNRFLDGADIEVDGLGDKPSIEPVVSESVPSETVSAERTEETIADSKDAPPSEEVVVTPISDDEGVVSAPGSLSGIKTANRSVDVPRYDNGITIVPLSSTGNPVTGCIVGSDGLINPYVSFGDSVQKPTEVPGLTPFTLAVSLESTSFYTVEYAICNQEEGFLLYIYQRRCTIFVGRSDWDYYTVVLATFRRVLPRKLTMFAAPLIDYVSRMGETLHRGIIPVYDAYRLANHIKDTDELRVSDILLPDTEDLAAALRQYSMVWKRSKLEPKDMEEAILVASLYSSAVYAWECTGTRYPHLYHNGVTYRLGWTACRLRPNYVLMTLHLDREKTSAADRRRCYTAMLQRLGGGSAYLMRGLRLKSCDPDDGLAVFVPLSAYPWAHNFLFLRLGEVAQKLLGRNISVTEECLCRTAPVQKEAVKEVAEPATSENQSADSQPEKVANSSEKNVQTEKKPVRKRAKTSDQKVEAVLKDKKAMEKLLSELVKSAEPDELPPPDVRPIKEPASEKKVTAFARKKDDDMLDAAF